MQNVSEEFKQAIKEPAREFKSKIELPGLTLDDNVISKIDLDSSLVFSEDFEIGTAPMDTAKVELIVDEDEWGRNLLGGTEFKTLPEVWGGAAVDIIEGDPNSVRLTATSTAFGVITEYITDVETGHEYTLSFECKTEDTAIFDYNYFMIEGESNKHLGNLGLTNIITDGQWSKYVVTFISSITKNNVGFMLGTRATNGTSFEVRKLKLEKGSTATPWSPAPEDILDYNYEDKECDIKLGIKLPDETTELLSMGKFTVEEAIKKDNKITLNYVDRMYKAEKDFKNNLMFPTTILDILQSACEQSNITLATTNFANANYVVPNEPVFENITCRHIFGQVAELAGGYAKINRSGELEILALGNTIEREITKDHYFEFKIDEVAIGKIDKVIVKVGDEEATAGTGENIYTIVDNMFVQDPNNVVGPIFNVLKDVNYTACDVNFQGDFSLDLGDKIEIDGHETYILDRKLKYTGGLREDYKAPAKSNVEKNSTGKSNIILDINNIKTQIKVIEGEITQSIEKIENLIVDAANRLYQSQTNIPFDLNKGVGTVQLFRNSYHPYYKVTSNTNIDLSASFPNSQFAEPLEDLGEVTISLDVLVDVDRIVVIDGKEFDVKANRWTRIHVTKTFTENTTKNIRARNPYSRKVSRDKVVGTKLIDSLTTNINTIYYRNLQVQRGMVATRWTLTPEELEENVNRLYSEIRQLEDSISLLVRRNDNTGRFEVNADGIIAEINKTDGVGRLKTVNVTIDDNGLTVDGGAVIIRDEQNTAIITPQGLKIMFHYQSSGELNGWQKVGQWSYAGHYDNEQASISFQIPEKMDVIQVILVVKSMPVYLRGFPYIPDGTYHPRNLRIYEAANPDIGIINYPANSTPTVQFYSGNAIDITDEIWGDTWTPTGTHIQRKIADITDIVTPGKAQTLLVKSIDSVYEQDYRYIGGMQFELTVDGYLRG